MHFPAVRSKISWRLIFASCVCDTPIARITGCVSLLRIYADDSPWNYSVASARVNSSSDANQSVRRNRKIWKR